MYAQEDEDLISGIDVLARQAEELIAKFNIEITHAPATNFGSDRYRKTAHAEDRLSRAEIQLQQSGRTVDWERTKVDGRTGSDVVVRLMEIRKRLQAVGEGARTGEQEMTDSPKLSMK